jgi:hypothetical protein
MDAHENENENHTTASDVNPCSPAQSFDLNTFGVKVFGRADRQTGHIHFKFYLQRIPHNN